MERKPPEEKWSVSPKTFIQSNIFGNEVIKSLSYSAQTTVYLPHNGLRISFFPVNLVVSLPKMSPVVRGRTRHLDPWTYTLNYADSLEKQSCLNGKSSLGVIFFYICLSLSDLLHLLWSSLGLPMQLQMELSSFIYMLIFLFNKVHLLLSLKRD